jgi:ATP-dependent DNA helicase RecQ
METIVFSGTKLNINYWVQEILDEDQQAELKEYFMEAETDSIETAVKEFNGDYEEEDIRIYRLKFISEIGN